MSRWSGLKLGLITACVCICISRRINRPMWHRVMNMNGIPGLITDVVWTVLEISGLGQSNSWLWG